jgi:Ca-activated chloride channel family protein
MEIFDSILIVNPAFLLLLLLVPFLVRWTIRRNNRDVLFRFSSSRHIPMHRTWRTVLHRMLPYLRGLTFCLLILALARPQKVLKEEQIKAEGIDIFLVMDLSSSMLAQDFDPDRLEVSKQVAVDFVNRREFDRIGLSVFAGESFTQCPLTTDHKIVRDFLRNLRCGLLEDGTAIGMGLATAINRLKDSQSDSKIIILLTDGENNAGYIRPRAAADIAQEFSIKVYTIGVGTTGDAIAPVSRRSDGRYIFDYAKVQIDEKLLTEIAESTGGKYYRATSAEKLQGIYDEIDKLEKTEMEISILRRYSDEHVRFVSLAFILLLAEILIRNLITRTFP